MAPKNKSKQTAGKKGPMILVVPESALKSKYQFTALDPAKVASVLKKFRMGEQFDEYFDLLEDVYIKDLRIGSELDKRFPAPAFTPWEVIPAGEDKQQKKIAEFVKQNIEQVPYLHRKLQEMNEAVYRSIRLIEIVWQWYGNEMWIEDLKPWPNNAFRFALDGSAKMLGKDDKETDLPPDKFVVHMVTRDGSFRRGGLGMSLLWYYLFKNYSFKDWGVFLEAYGMPLRVGKYKVGSTPDDVQLLKDALISLGSDFGCVIRDDMLIDFVEANKTTSTDAYERRIRYIDAEISIRINGQVLTSQGSDQGAGARSLGEVHQDIKDEIKLGDCLDLADTINAQLVVPLVNMNFGEQDAYPIFKFKTEKSPDYQANAVLVKTLLESGLPLAEEDVYPRVGFPAPKPESKLIKPPQQVSPWQPGQPGAAATMTMKAPTAGPSPTAGLVAPIIDKLRRELGPEYDAMLMSVRAQIDDGVKPENLKINNSKISEKLARYLLLSRLYGRHQELRDSGLTK